MQAVKRRFISIEPLHIEVDILFIIILPVILLTGHFNRYAIAYTSMAAHELGHIACGVLTGRRVHQVRVLPVGLSASMHEGLSGRSGRMLMLACGPLTNILFCLTGLLIYSCCLPESDSIRLFVISNASLAVFNLLPILPLDGGKILRELLSGQVGIFRGDRNARRISYAISLFLIALGTNQAYSGMYNFSLLLTGFYLFFMIRNDIMEEAAFMTIKDVIYRRSRFLKKGVYPVRDLVALKSMQLGEIIKHMDFDRFHFIYILDENMKLLAVFTEQQIMDGIMKHGADMDFGEFIKMLEG